MLNPFLFIIFNINKYLGVVYENCKVFLLTALLVCISLGYTSIPGGGGCIKTCDPGDPQYEPNNYDYDHIFMYYIGADNDLDNWAIMELQELESINKGDRIKIIAFVDFNQTQKIPQLPESKSISTKCALIDISYNPNSDLTYNADTKQYNSPLISQRIADTKYLGINNSGIIDFDSANPETLESFLKYCITNYKSYRYSLIIYSHGAGIMVSPNYAGEDYPLDDRTLSVVWDESDEGEHYMSLAGLTIALANTSTLENLSGQKLGFIGLSACFMGVLDNFHSLSFFSDYIVASEEQFYITGFNNDRAISTWMNDIDYPTRIKHLAYYFAYETSEFFKEYNENPWYPGDTPGCLYRGLPYLNLTVIDSSKMESITSYYSALWDHEYKVLRNLTENPFNYHCSSYSQSTIPYMKAIRDNTIQYTRSAGLFGIIYILLGINHYIDLYSFVDNYIDFWNNPMNKSLISQDEYNTRMDIAHKLKNSIEGAIVYHWNRTNDPDGIDSDPCNTCWTNKYGESNGISIFYPSQDYSGYDDKISTYLSRIPSLFKVYDYYLMEGCFEQPN